VWLDPQRTSPFRFYQFWLNTDDATFVRHLKSFTWLDAAPSTRSSVPSTRRRRPRRPARAGTRGHADGARRAELQRAVRASQVLFGGSLAEATAEDILTVFDDVPSVTLSRDVLLGSGWRSPRRRYPPLL
jgi:tyrosyl-tRNA synthetase